MRTRLRLFLDWGISFGEPYQLPERAARTVAYASKQELEQAILCCHHGQYVYSDMLSPPPVPSKVPPARSGAFYSQNRQSQAEIVERSDLRTGRGERQ